MAMPIVAVTRLHVASLWSCPPFLYYAFVSARQARRSPGFVTGWLSNDSERSNWTATVWQSADAMRAFRNSGVHLKAMPKLLRWCDEASYVHWEQPDEAAPTPEIAYERLQGGGKLSKVNAPSARQLAGQTVGRAKARAGQRLTVIR